MKQWLEDQSLQLQLYTNRKTLPMVVSGLKCWHNFAVNVLDYHNNATLPPRKCSDVVRYTAVFTNSGTAANYIGHIKKACFLLSLPVETWYQQPVRVALKGLTKATIDHFGGPQRCRFF